MPVTRRHRSEASWLRRKHSRECAELRNCGEQRVRRRIVSKRFAEMRKPLDVAGSKHKASAELKRIFPEFVLFVTRGTRSFTCLGIVTAQKVEKIPGFQLGRLIRLPFL